MADALTSLQETPTDAQQGSAPIDARSQSGIWERIQQALKAGLISSDQFQQMSAKMGYTPQNVAQTPVPQNGKIGGNYATGVKEPDVAGNGKDLASNLGSTVGGIVGQAGRSIYDRATAPAAPLDINPPSPAWNQ